MSNCKFCGAGIKKAYKAWDRLGCESARYNSDGNFETFYTRATECYEAEITALKALVRESIKILNWVKSPEFYAQGRLRRDIKILEFIERPEVRAILGELLNGNKQNPRTP
jgi:predicted HTH transcriptional regulator